MNTRLGNALRGGELDLSNDLRIIKRDDIGVGHYDIIHSVLTTVGHVELTEIADRKAGARNNTPAWLKGHQHDVTILGTSGVETVSTVGALKSAIIRQCRRSKIRQVREIA